MNPRGGRGALIMITMALIMTMGTLIIIRLALIGGALMTGNAAHDSDGAAACGVADHDFGDDDHDDGDAANGFCDATHDYGGTARCSCFRGHCS